ncbi:MAG TPA: phosphopantetheine-binding protein [Microvirga sp.]|nr:phosphopantetheine-binding protein [Microvirga sp.]
MNVRVDTDLQTPFEREISSLIVEALHLEITPEEIRPSEALFGDGLCLDSIDALEIALAVSSRYGFQLKSDDERNQQIFASLRSLAAFVQQHRTR